MEMPQGQRWGTAGLGASAVPQPLELGRQQHREWLGCMGQVAPRLLLPQRQAEGHQPLEPSLGSGCPSLDPGQWQDWSHRSVLGGSRGGCQLSTAFSLQTGLVLGLPARPLPPTAALDHSTSLQLLGASPMMGG